MDFYSYYKERFTWGHNPYESVAQCQKVVMELMNDHLIPLRISAESATGYLAALYDFASDGCAVSFPFRIVMCALNNAMERAYTAVENIDRERAKQAMEDMRADGLIPVYDPGDYEVQDADLEGIEMDGVDDDPAINELHLCDKESEGRHSSRHIDGLDSESEGLSKHFLHFQGIESWGKARWAAFTAQIDRAINIAATDPAGVDSMAHLLSNIRDNFDKIPVGSQEQALVAADKLVLSIRENMESIMDALQDKRQIALISECIDADDWDCENDATEGFIVKAPDVNESVASLISEQQSYLDLSGWGCWGEEDWSIFDQAIADARAAAIASPADPMPAMHLFGGIRQNIETLERHRRFDMGNTADDLLEAIKKGMAQDLFQIQKKCPYSPRPMPIMSSESQSRDAVQLSPEYTVAPTPDNSDRRWKKGRVGRELVALDFDRLDEWKLSQWAALKIHSDKLTAAAEMTTDALGQPGQLLEDLRAHVQQIPPHYKEDASQIASQLVQAISGRISEALAEILQYCGQSDAKAGGAIILSFSCDEEEGSKGWKISDMYIPKLSMPAYPLLASLSQELLNRIQEDTPQTEQDLEILIQHHLDSAELCRFRVQKISGAPQKHRVSFLIFMVEHVK